MDASPQEQNEMNAQQNIINPPKRCRIRFKSLLLVMMGILCKASWDMEEEGGSDNHTYKAWYGIRRWFFLFFFRALLWKFPDLNGFNVKCQKKEAWRAKVALWWTVFNHDGQGSARKKTTHNKNDVWRHAEKAWKLIGWRKGCWKSAAFIQESATDTCRRSGRPFFSDVRGGWGGGGAKGKPAGWGFF